MAVNILQGFSVGNNEPIDDRIVVASKAARNAIDVSGLYQGLTVYINDYSTQGDTGGELWLLRDLAAFTAALPSDTTDAGWVQLDYSGGSVDLTQEAIETAITDKAAFRADIGVSDDQHIPTAPEILDQVDRSNQPTTTNTNIIPNGITGVIQAGELRSLNELSLVFPTTITAETLETTFTTGTGDDRVGIELALTVADAPPVDYNSADVIIRFDDVRSTGIVNRANFTVIRGQQVLLADSRQQFEQTFPRTILDNANVHLLDVLYIVTQPATTAREFLSVNTDDDYEFTALNERNPDLNIGNDEPQINNDFGGLRIEARNGINELEVDTDQLPLEGWGNVGGVFGDTQVAARPAGSVLSWRNTIGDDGVDATNHAKWGGIWSPARLPYGDLVDLPTFEIRTIAGMDYISTLPLDIPAGSSDTVEFYDRGPNNPRLIGVIPAANDTNVARALDIQISAFTPTGDNFIYMEFRDGSERYLALMQGPRVTTGVNDNVYAFSLVELYNNTPGDNFGDIVPTPFTPAGIFDIDGLIGNISGSRAVLRGANTPSQQGPGAVAIIDVPATGMAAVDSGEIARRGSGATADYFLNVTRRTTNNAGTIQVDSTTNFDDEVRWRQIEGGSAPPTPAGMDGQDVRVVLQETPMSRTDTTFSVPATTDATTVVVTAASLNSSYIQVNTGIRIQQGGADEIEGYITSISGSTFTVRSISSLYNFTAGAVLIQTEPVVFPGQILRTPSTASRTPDNRNDNSRYFLVLDLADGLPSTTDISPSGLNNQERFREISHQINFQTQQAREYNSSTDNDLTAFTVTPVAGETPAFGFFTFRDQNAARNFILRLQNQVDPNLGTEESAGRITTPGTIQAVTAPVATRPNVPVLVDLSFIETPAGPINASFAWNYFPSSQTIINGITVAGQTVRIPLEENVAAAIQYTISTTTNTSVTVGHLFTRAVDLYDTTNDNTFNLVTNESTRLIAQEEVIAGTRDFATRTDVANDIVDFNRNTHVAHIESRQVAGTKVVREINIHEIRPAITGADQNNRLEVNTTTQDASALLTDSQYGELITAFDLDELDANNLIPIAGQSLQTNLNQGLSSIPAQDRTAEPGNWFASFNRNATLQTFTEDTTPFTSFTPNLRTGAQVRIEQTGVASAVGIINGVARRGSGTGADVTVLFEENVSFTSPFSNPLDQAGVTITVLAAPLIEGTFTINDIVENMVTTVVPNTGNNRRLSVSRIDRAGVAPNFGPFRPIPADHRLLHIVHPSGPGGGNIDGVGYDFNSIELLYRTAPPQGSQGNGTGRVRLWADHQTLPDRNGNQQGNRRTTRIAENFSNIGINETQYRIYEGATDINSSGSNANAQLVNDIYGFLQNPLSAPNVNQNVLDNLIGVEFFYEDNIPEPRNPAIPVARTLIGYDNANDAPDQSVFQLALAPGMRTRITPTSPRTWIASGAVSDAGLRYLRSLVPQALAGPFRSDDVTAGNTATFTSTNALPDVIQEGANVRVVQGNTDVTGEVVTVVQADNEFSFRFTGNHSFAVGAVTVTFIPSLFPAASVFGTRLESNLNILNRVIPNTDGRLDFYARSTGILGTDSINIPQVEFTESTPAGEVTRIDGLTINGRDIPVPVRTGSVTQIQEYRPTLELTQIRLSGVDYGIGRTSYAGNLIPRDPSSPEIGENGNTTTLPNGGIYLKTSNQPERWRVTDTQGQPTSTWRDVVDQTTINAGATGNRIIVERFRTGNAGGILFANVGSTSGNFQGNPIANSGVTSYGASRINRADWDNLSTRGFGASPRTAGTGLFFNEIFGNPGQASDGWHAIEWRLINALDNNIVTEPANALIRLRTTNSPSSVPDEFLFMEWATGTISSGNFVPNRFNHLDDLNIATTLYRSPNATDHRPDGGAAPQVWALQVNVPNMDTHQSLLQSGMYQYNASTTDNGRWEVYQNNPRIINTI